LHASRRSGVHRLWRQKASIGCPHLLKFDILRGSREQVSRARAEQYDSNTTERHSMADAVAEKVIATLASVKRIPAENIKLDTNLQEMGIDSLDVFTLLFELENAFKITIPDDDVRSIKTVNDIVEGVKKLLAAAPPDTSIGSASTAD
jgi:acyl carrier protein